MSDLCAAIHQAAGRLKRYSFSFDESKLPLNGIYLLFEKGESGHDSDRIVRIGTHTGNGKLVSRLREHFIAENKDRSIFRKNIGRALLSKKSDPFLEYWELDLTTRRARERYGSIIDFGYQRQIEKDVSLYIRDNLSFAVIEINDKKERLATEAKLISTISLCNECRASKSWLGELSPKIKIRESGLWQEQGLFNEVTDVSDIAGFMECVR